MFTGSTQANVGLWWDAQIASDLARAAMLSMVKWTLQGTPGAIDALAQATVCLKKVWTIAEVIRPDDEPSLVSLSAAARMAELDDQIKGLQALQFKTNDILRVRGKLDGERSVQISGLAPISLGKRSFLVLKALAKHAVAYPGSYMSTTDLAAAIQTELAAHSAQTDCAFWSDLIGDDLHKVIKQIRDAMEEAGGNRNLIESSESYAGGFRISTPQWNILIEDMDSE